MFSSDTSELDSGEQKDHEEEQRITSGFSSDTPELGSGEQEDQEEEEKNNLRVQLQYSGV